MLVKTIRFVQGSEYGGLSKSFYNTDKDEQKQYGELLFLCHGPVLARVELGDANSFVIKIYTSPGRNRLRLGINAAMSGTTYINDVQVLFGEETYIYIRDMFEQLKSKYPNKVGKYLYVGFFNDDKTKQFKLV